MLINGFVPEQQVINLSQSKTKSEKDTEEHRPTPLAFP
jgi:hypothetical protein